MKQLALAAVALGLLAAPPTLAAQDYTMYEVQRMRALPGSTVDIGQAMVEHNRLFHAEAPYTGAVFYFVTGRYAGQYQWVMGPTTFAQIDSRPADAAHGSDWSNRVLTNAVAVDNEYWRLVDDLSYTPQGLSDAPRPVALVRRFTVTDEALFVKVQRQIMEALSAAGLENPRTMYRRQFLSSDPWGWVVITTYPDFASLDKPGVDFEAAFRSRHGDAAWTTFNEEFGQAITAREDMLRQLIRP